MVMTSYHPSMTLNAKTTRTLKIVHDQYVVAQESAYDTREDLILTLRQAREAGATNQELGDVLGVTRQRISQLLREDPSPRD